VAWFGSRREILWAFYPEIREGAGLCDQMFPLLQQLPACSMATQSLANRNLNSHNPVLWGSSHTLMMRESFRGTQGYAA
jgi:hypothetical protein